MKAYICMITELDGLIEGVHNVVFLNKKTLIKEIKDVYNARSLRDQYKEHIMTLLSLFDKPFKEENWFEVTYQNTTLIGEIKEASVNCDLEENN